MVSFRNNLKIKDMLVPRIWLANCSTWDAPGAESFWRGGRKR
jgi:hypothetical protein